MYKRISLFVMALMFLMSAGVFAAETDTDAQTPVSSVEETEEDVALRLRKEDVIFLHIDNYATVSDGVLKWIDRGNQAVKPFIKEGRTMVPLRFITEELGATVVYDGATRGITITLGDTVMSLTVGQKAYTLNGQMFQMDSEALVMENRTFVPVRFVSEALGRAVQWLGDERIVVVTPADALWDSENPVEKAALAEVQLSLSPLGRNKVQ